LGVHVRTTWAAATATTNGHARPGLARHAPALSVLQGASAVLHRGWLQHAEREVRTADGRLTTRGRGELVRSCLVAAVMEAARWQDDDPSSAGPALDALWLTLYEHCGARDGAVGPVPPPAVRELRARELARWNDSTERTVAEVLALVDRAAERVRAEMRPDVGEQPTASVREPAAC
jgi:hypothetical protein